MNNRKIVALCFCFLGYWSQLEAQFQLNGSAIAEGGGCYQLTQTQNVQAGSIWNLDKINLDQSFEAVLEIFLGCKDADGADGIVFGFQPVSTSIGVAGGEIGFGGVTPSLGVEFDTFQNGDLNDPEYDHIAIIQNGDLNHGGPNNLSGPVQALATGPNLEDCKWHELRVSWNAQTQALRIYVDCSLRILYVGDVVNDIFGGDPEVFWGFTAATGALNNFQEVCLSYTTFLDQLEDVVLCPNGSIQLEVTGGQNYEWSPPEGLSNPFIANPIASPTETTSYTVAIFDDCGVPLYDSILVTVDGDSSFVDLGQDTILCSGDFLLLDAYNPNSTYLWNTGDTSAIIEVNSNGQYSVTVTVDEYCFDSGIINIDVIPLPTANLTADDPLCEGSSLFLDVTIDDPNAEYIWQDGWEQSIYEVTGPGTYSVTVSNACGKATGSITLEYETCREFYLPNIFSPDNNGLNDYFFVQDGGDIREISYMRIFDRWGGLVYERHNLQSNDLLAGWDGTSRGKEVSEGIYVWIMEGFFKDGEPFLEMGDVMVLR
ncbi:MAG: gliding motility-associated C-terminal domain-containing protein [Saprospiraceae bacterium]|nr:gliding motility-associated C-terminal domain-containing protein [Saprospiraceae bacterium]